MIPELAGQIAAVGYDADTRRLTVCQVSAAWATKTRLEQARIIATANESAGRTVVRTLKILAPGTVPVRERADAEPEPAAAPGRPPRMATAARSPPTRPSRPPGKSTRAFERQTQAMRKLSRRVFPEPETSSDDQPTPLEAARVQRRRESEATRALARRRARAERTA
ncbi:DciA family protein [Streptomyces misionensis]|uniref:DciA family protein n=1 Tax=Streptomyces misionensis TaxID=67331 RepID=UPI00396BA074